VTYGGAIGRPAGVESVAPHAVAPVGDQNEDLPLTVTMTGSASGSFPELRR